MLVIKYFSITFIVIISTIVGILYSNKYEKRLKELEDIKRGLNIFKTKIGFTYEPIPEVFTQIEKQLNSSIGKMFLVASKNMEKDDAGKSWENAVREEKVHTNLDKRDIEVILGLSKMLGQTDLDGQINNIDLTCSLIDNQIAEARISKNKNEKMYKTLGTTIGLAIAIILI